MKGLVFVGVPRRDQTEHLADRGKLLGLEYALKRRRHKADAVGVLLTLEYREIALDGSGVGERRCQTDAKRAQMVWVGRSSQASLSMVL